MAEGVEEIDLRRYEFRDNLFDLFCQQLKKDFESCGIDAEFTSELVPDLQLLNTILLNRLREVMRSDSVFRSLLYRIDVSEAMINSYRARHPDLDFDQLITELIIRRVLQKVILKKRFSP